MFRPMFQVEKMSDGYGVFRVEPEDMEESGHHTSGAVLHGFAEPEPAQRAAGALEHWYRQGRTDAFKELRRLIGAGQ